LFTVETYSAPCRWEDLKTALSIAPEDHSQTCIKPGVIWMDGKEVLREGEIHGAVAIEICNSDPKDRGPLGFPGEWMGIKPAFTIQQNHGFQTVRGAATQGRCRQSDHV
jgi:hypothetical protein